MIKITPPNQIPSNWNFAQKPLAEPKNFLKHIQTQLPAVRKTILKNRVMCITAAFVTITLIASYLFFRFFHQTKSLTQKEFEQILETAEQKINCIKNKNLKNDFVTSINLIKDNVKEFIQKSPDFKEDIYENGKTELSFFICEIDEICKHLPDNIEFTKASKEVLEWQNKIKQKMRLNTSTEELKKDLETIHINEPGLTRGTILHFAAKMHNYTYYIRQIMDAGGLNTAQDFMGNTPLMWAIANANNASAIEIIENEKNQDYLQIQSYENNNTALILAVGKGYTDSSQDQRILKYSNLQIAEKILEKSDASINIANAKGYTPLHLAYLRHDRSMIDLLEKKGASKDEKTNNGKLPSDMWHLPYEEACVILTETVVVFSIKPR